ncbi:alpha-2-macroglobulin family protein [Aureliella helgolandensis]|uniref:MG2 domain protein n=1 Tax=Aureliella helgolandensis TaxID=2527968 RepID=A0A518G6N0_9BACT|nr:MG2 domain-containing protein [Aureliella helgolandensis]QDV24242.1 MG2 domain protein [Aureliella helgolandensis]
MRRFVPFPVLACMAAALLTAIAMAVQAPSTAERFESAEKLFADHNYKEAGEAYRDVLRSSDAQPARVVQAMTQLEQCRNQLGEVHFVDSDLRTAVEIHGRAYQVLDTAAEILLRSIPYGTVADQEFSRGHGRGYAGRGGAGGMGISVGEQDRLQALKWRHRALELASQADSTIEPAELAKLHLRFAETLLHNRDTRQAWRLQALTDLTAEPDYLDFDSAGYGPARYAPVDASGTPVFYDLPESLGTAASDGARFRWALAQAERAPQVAPQASLQWAQFLSGQFSVETLQAEQWIFRGGNNDAEEIQTKRLSLHTLEESETLARLANGIQRIELPDDFNAIRVYQKLSAPNVDDQRVAEEALSKLVQIFLNRRQYPKAAELLRDSISRFDNNPEVRQQLLDSIVEPRLAFDPVPSQVAGEPAKLSVLFRNTNTISLSARRVDLEKLITDTKQYYRNFTNQDRNQFGGLKGVYPPQLSVPSNLFEGQIAEKYLIDAPVKWQTEVESRENHWDRRQAIDTPLKKAGLYLIEADVNDKAHLARCLLWIQDTIVIRKPLAGEWLLDVVDATTGKPIAGANLEFFGFGHKNNTPPSQARRYNTENRAQKTNSEGQARVRLDGNLQWLTVARTADGRLALLDFQHIWLRNNYQLQTLSQAKAYGVTDRPLYRPGDTVKAKFWVAQTVYGDEAAPPLAHRSISFHAYDAQGNQVFAKAVTSDEFGACDVEFELPKTTSLGTYRFSVESIDPANGVPRLDLQSNAVFRVEEYRKPEFEVKVLSPQEPVALGDTISARIQAKYYFGAPVTDAVVNVKVERSTYRDNYYPVRPYDWCYDPGYWWFAEDYIWYPGWKGWAGCVSPFPWWYPRYGNEPPELVLEQELSLDGSGEATVEIDTSLAKALYGDEDHEYTISVDVRDSSRRTISAVGKTIASQAPFKVYTWVDRGYYQVGQRIDASFQTQMLDGTDVEVTGTLELMHITYDEAGTPSERSVYSAAVKTDANGFLTHPLTAADAGQYRIRTRFKGPGTSEVEGGYILTVRGEGSTDSDFRYNALELTPDLPHYAAGDKVRLLVASEHADARVVLFVRPSEGVYPQPQIVQLMGKTAVVEIPVLGSDQPNFFVEAYTVYDGNLHSATREIIVPPADRVLNVEMNADKAEYLPGEEAQVSIVVTDPDGHPVSGSCAIAVYDRSLEQIASDVLPQDIREFFWKWRRQHSPQQSSNAELVSRPLSIHDIYPLQPLGIFGNSIADDGESMSDGLARGLGLGGGAPGGRLFGTSDFGGAMGGGYGGFAPMSAMSMDASAGMRMEKSGGMGGGVAATPPATAATPAIRKDFADSALWLSAVTTDSQGRAMAKFNMPENLTGWRMKSWAVGHGTKVGSGQTEAVTRKPLLIRLQTPRFVVERDQVVISGIVHNDLPTAQEVQVRLEIDGETQIEFADRETRVRTVTIGAHEQARVDWRLNALAEGTVALTAIATSGDASDAMQLKLPVLVNGILKTDAVAGTVRGDQASNSVSIAIPAQRRIEQSKFTVRLSPSLAAAMVDALPYMAEYPYGCTEQTLNRFLPSVITQQILQKMGVDMASLKDRRANLNAQELGDPASRASQWKRFDRTAVFDEQLVDEMVAAGIQRLTDMQCNDGGWGWFSGPREFSTAHTTATVVRGLLIAQQNGEAIVPDVLQRGLQWLATYQTNELLKLKNWSDKTHPFKAHPDNLDALVFHTLVLGKEQATEANSEMQQRLYDSRGHLSVYGMTLFAWATHALGNSEQTSMLRRNIEQFLVQDAENETAFLKNDASWWNWYGSSIEANALYLKLLAATDPQGQTAPRVVKYLLNNRKHATYWNSTRDTALVVEAFGDYLTASGENQANMSAEVYLGGKRLGRVDFTPENLFSVDNTIEIHGNAVPAGTHQLEIRRSGEGNLYWNAYSTNFTLEEEIEAAGLEVKVERRYYRLDPVQKDLQIPDAQAGVLDAKKSGYNRVLLDDLQTVESGVLVEVELLVESKNDYEYILIEDRKPACLEAVESQSGYFYSGGLPIYREFRDTHIGLCIRQLPQGNYSLRYQFRSETPGTFTALPATIQGMYAPELAGNSRDFDVIVTDEQQN